MLEVRHVIAFDFLLEFFDFVIPVTGIINAFLDTGNAIPYCTIVRLTAKKA